MDKVRIQAAPASLGERRASARRGDRAGFTLMEAALTTVIIGTGVLAILAAQQAYHKKNAWAQRTATALLLANEIRELSLRLPMHDPITGLTHLGPEDNETSVTSYDDLDDFAGTVNGAGVGSGTTFTPPINALRQPIDDLAGWSQHVDVANVLPDNISSTYTQPLGTTDLVRVTVTIRYTAPNTTDSVVITTLAWVVGQ